jgi:hypothetical protein
MCSCPSFTASRSSNPAVLEHKLRDLREGLEVGAGWWLSIAPRTWFAQCKRAFAFPRAFRIMLRADKAPRKAGAIALVYMLQKPPMLLS